VGEGEEKAPISDPRKGRGRRIVRLAGRANVAARGRGVGERAWAAARPGRRSCGARGGPTNKRERGKGVEGKRLMGRKWAKMARVWVRSICFVFFVFSFLLKI
jgi:hypothetical protein